MTIGEGEAVPPNTTFTKTWRISNPGKLIKTSLSPVFHRHHWQPSAKIFGLYKFLGSELSLMELLGPDEKLCHCLVKFGNRVLATGRVGTPSFFSSKSIVYKSWFITRSRTQEHQGAGI